MISSTRKKVFLGFLILTCVLTLLWIAVNQINNPLDARASILRDEIDQIELIPVFYIANSETNYNDIYNSFGGRVGLWNELIAPPAKAAPVITGPNFEELLKGVVPSLRRQMKVGDSLKVHVVSPDNPRGTWVQIGDKLKSTDIIAITDSHLILEKNANNKKYKYNLPRK
jgi:hypothetical protein